MLSLLNSKGQEKQKQPTWMSEREIWEDLKDNIELYKTEAEGVFQMDFYDMVNRDPLPILPPSDTIWRMG